MKNGLVCKQTAVLVVRINNIGHNNDVLGDFQPFFSLYTLPHTSVDLTSCISTVFFSFEYFDLFDHYAACWVPLMILKKILTIFYGYFGINVV